MVPDSVKREVNSLPDRAVDQLTKLECHGELGRAIHAVERAVGEIKRAVEKDDLIRAVAELDRAAYKVRCVVNSYGRR
ncbi:MAG: hypothetical protein K6U74_11225 [Firmicutes bacterium]|nr:hypothetical protein [Bacillota bacterium]